MTVQFYLIVTRGVFGFFSIQCYMMAVRNLLNLRRFQLVR